MEFFGDYTLRVVALGSGVLGAAAGALGSFAYLRRQSLVGDALSHAALPGIALTFLLTGSKAPLPIMLGAALAGWIATLAVPEKQPLDYGTSRALTQAQHAHIMCRNAEPDLTD